MRITNKYILQNSQNRITDENGYLTVSNCPLLREGIMEYLGTELMESANEIDGVKLEKDKTYKLNISKEELEKALDTFKLIPIVNEHSFLGKDEKNAKGLQEGAVGQDLKMEKLMDDDGVERNFITGTVNFTNERTVEIISKGEKEELSTAYVNDLKKSANSDYDFEVVDIKGNHIALVTKGRAGSKVRVVNSNIINKSSDSTMKNKYMMNGEEVSADDLLKVLKEEAEYHKDKPVSDKTENEEAEDKEDTKENKCKNEEEKAPKDKEPEDKTENEDEDEEAENKKAKNKKKSSNSVSVALMNSTIEKVKQEVRDEFSNRMKAYNSVKGKVGEFDCSDMDEKAIYSHALKNSGISLEGNEELQALRLSFKVLNEKTKIDNSSIDMSAHKELIPSHIK